MKLLQQMPLISVGFPLGVCFSINAPIPNQPNPTYPSPSYPFHPLSCFEGFLPGFGNEKVKGDTNFKCFSGSVK